MVRSMEMSGVGVTSILPVLPTVLFRTHYGSMWFLRLAGLSVAWVGSQYGWYGKRRMGSRYVDIFLLCAVATIAFSRSASGHPADFGDLHPQQLADWLHLLAVSSWGGTLVALAIVFPPALVAGDNPMQRLVAGIADRYYVLFGPSAGHPGVHRNLQCLAFSRKFSGAGNDPLRWTAFRQATAPPCAC